MTDNRKKKIVERYWQQIVIDFAGYQVERDDIYTELLDENERASVLVGAAWLEECLRDLIRLVLPNDKKVADYFLKRILPFSYRIDAAKKLGLISKVEKKRLDVIGEIRNKFAHRVTTSFDDPKVADPMAKLEPLPARSHEPPIDAFNLQVLDKPQEKYAYLVTQLFFLINGRLIMARELNDVAARLETLRTISKAIDEES